MKNLHCFTRPLIWLSAWVAALMMTAFVAGCGGDQGRDPILGLPSVDLVSLAVTPATASAAVGGVQQFVATATFADGTVRDVSASSAWVSSIPAVATVNSTSGVATGVSGGTSTIMATFGNKSGSSVFTVGPPTLISIALTPVNPTLQMGATQQLTVIGTYSDGTTVTVTNSSAFVSATPATATVGASSGLVTGVVAGTSIVTGTFGGKSATTTVTVSAAVLSSIAVTPANPSVLVGSSQQFIATATYSDNTTANITNNVIWASSATGVATIAQTGMASAVAAGVTTISATQGAKTGSTSLTVAAVPVAVGISLGGATNFGVLAATSITNNSGGTTLVTGDVGSPSQTVDPVQAAGYANYKSGAVLTTALANMQTAITDANSRTCNVSSAAGIDLGGLTFGPGVYCYSGAISITGTFTMNGPGLYIFRTSSTLNTTANSIVAFTGGATATTVFWVPVSATTLGANSVFKGTIMTPSAAITLGDHASLQNGRVLTGSATTLANNAITIP